jgi:hypothetical protein
MKSIFKVRYQNKPWIEGSGVCSKCERRFLIESCRSGCSVIADYQLRRGLLFVKRDSIESTNRHSC